MKRIHFNEETINQIRDFISSGHTISETCNKFTLKEDTLRRVMFENNIQPFYTNKSVTKREVTDEDVNLICNLFQYTNTRIDDIVKETKLQNYIVQKVLDDHFSQEFQDARKSKIYRMSKLGDKNPMYGLRGEQTSNYIGGVVEDGKGYLMVKKPDWWTSRKKSDYVFQHHVVIAEALGINEIPRGFAVHHIDGNKKNNDLSNLALVQAGAHSKWHAMLKNLCKVQRLSDKE